MPSLIQPCSKPFALLVGCCLAWSLAGAQPPEPRIHPGGIDGALVLCGGGKLPEAVYERFVQLAGGENAKLVIIPTGSDTANNGDAEKLLVPWKARKVASAIALHMRDRRVADDPKFAGPLREATGVWFGGGQQSRIAEAYVGTAV